MRVGILGPLEVVSSDDDSDTGERGAGTGTVVQIGGARLRSLLIRLALDAGRTVSVDALADAVWDDALPADRANALQSLVSRLRRLLPEPVLTSVANGYRLDIAPEDVDALRFERLVMRGREALRAHDPVTARDLLTTALGLWRGQALADVAQARYAAAPAARWEELRLVALEDRAEADLALGRSPVAELEELVAAHPLRERPRLLLMRALAAAGRRAEALASYEEFRRLLAEELGTDPSPELRETHLAVLRGEAVRAGTAVAGAAAAGKEPSTTSPRRGNWGTPLTNFIGRDEELQRITKQLSHNRLVTLVGPGGAGKTRLATVAADRITDQTPGGVWLVELARVTDPADVPAAVVRALDLRDRRFLDTHTVVAREPVDRLVDALGNSQSLLVLDNCEHVVEAVASLVEELLGRCPDLRVLATSREPLGIFGEALCPVPPLRLPAVGMTAQEALEYPAIQLFVDRASTVRPDFALTDENVEAVVEICRRLDGLPLAIELAAVRVRSLSVEQVATRLNLSLLTGGSRTAMPRHRTLRAVIAWSWDLLSDIERDVARRIAVFPGGVTPESAAAVCGGTFELLQALVDKSLLQVVDDREPRYRMLETIREYALEELGEAAQEVRRSHAAYFLQLAETAEPHLRRPEQLTWIAKLTAEQDNLTAALRFACDTGDAATAIRLGAALSMFWTIQENQAEAVIWLRRVLQVPGEAPLQARLIAQVFYLLNETVSGMHEVTSEQQTLRSAALEELLKAIHDLDPFTGHPLLALVEPIVALFVYVDPAWSKAAIERTLAHPDPWVRAMLWLMRSIERENDGDVAGQQENLVLATAAFRELGERWGLATCLTGLAMLRRQLGDIDSAIETLEEAIVLSEQLGAAEDVMYQRAVLAMFRAQKGEKKRAHSELRELIESGYRDGSISGVASALLVSGDLSRYDGDLGEAARCYQEAWERVGRRLFVAPQLRALLRSQMAHLEVGRGDLDRARRYIAEAVAYAIESRDIPILARVAVARASVWLGQQDFVKAAEVLGAAERIRGTPDPSDPDVARLERTLCEQLGEAAFQVAYQRGRGLDRNAAVALVKEGFKEDFREPNRPR